MDKVCAGGVKALDDLPPKDRDIAMVFQNYALYPHMTVEDNLAFFPSTHPRRAEAPGQFDHFVSLPLPDVTGSLDRLELFRTVISGGCGSTRPSDATNVQAHPQRGPPAAPFFIRGTGPAQRQDGQLAVAGRAALL